MSSEEDPAYKRIIESLTNLGNNFSTPPGWEEKVLETAAKDGRDKFENFEFHILTKTPNQSMTLDGIELRYHVREKDNRIAIVLTLPGWAIQQPYDFWYVSVDVLKGDKWEHRPGSTFSGGGVRYHKAIEILKEFYDREAKS